jgi:hypothetical protein
MSGPTPRWGILVGVDGSELKPATNVPPLHPRPTADSPGSVNDQGTLHRMRNSGAHRAQQHAGESATTVASDHHELRVLGFLNEPVGRFVADEPSLDLQIGILFLPTGQAFGQDLRSLGFVLPPVHAEDREDPDIAPRVQGNKVHPSTRRFVEGQLGRPF